MASRNDLGGWGLKAERHWREYRPKMVKAMEEAGTLYDHLLEAENRAEDLWEELVKKGLSDMEAREWAEREFILLPEEDQETPDEDSTT